MERRQPSLGHSPAGDHIRREELGQRKKVTGPGELTSWRPQRKGHIRTEKESDQARGAHILETTEGGTSQNMEREQLSKGHTQTGDQRGRDKSEHKKKATEWGPLTCWRWHRRGQVRTQKESN